MPSCRFFLQGHCNRGGRCPFEHPQPENQSSSSSALRADATAFVPNTPASTSIQSSPSILFSQPCRYFTKGSCLNGEACSYRHITPAVEHEVTARSDAFSPHGKVSISAVLPNSTGTTSTSEKLIAEESCVSGPMTNLVRLYICCPLATLTDGP